MAGAESRLGRVNAGMRDQVQTYESRRRIGKRISVTFVWRNDVGSCVRRARSAALYRQRQKGSAGSPLPAAISKWNE